MSTVPTGQYRLVNVTYGTMIHLQDANGTLSARKGTVDGTVQWTITNVSDEKYTLQNVAYSTYAWVKHWSNEEDDLKGKSSARYFCISQAGNTGHYLIATPDSDLCWGLDNEDDGTRLSLCSDASDPRSLWKFEPAKAQASSATNSRSSDLPCGLNSGICGKLKSGQYILTNVRSRNIAALLDPNDGSSLLASVLDDTKSGLWDVILHSNGRFEIKNVGHGMCAWVESRAPANAEVQGRAPARLSRYYDIRETGAKGRYVISTTDSKLLWGLDDDECGTSICLRSAAATDSRNQWKLIPFREGASLDQERFEDAIRSGEEAIDSNRQQAADDPSKRAALAQSLHDQAGTLEELGREQEAVPVAEEAVKIRRDLARKDPNALPDLASSLHNLAGYQYTLDIDDSAARNIAEAIEIRRHLFTVTSNKELGLKLAQSLEEQADYVYNNDCNSSVTAIQEAIKLRLALDSDDEYMLSDLADCYERLTGYLEDLERPQEAVRSAHEAITIRRKLAADDDKLLPELATSLHDHASSLSELEDHSNAAVCLDEAIKIRQQLATELLRDLGESLQNRANCLQEMGRLQEAATSAGKAVKVRRRLVDDDGDDFPAQSDLASSLRAYAKYASGLGDHQTATRVVRDAIRVLRLVVAEDTATDDDDDDDEDDNDEDGSDTSSDLEDDDSPALDDLAGCIDEAATYQAKMGNYQDAARTIEEAIKIYRDLTSDSELADSLHNRATYLAEMGCLGEAVACMKEACDLREKLEDEEDELETSRRLLASYLRRI